MSKNRFTRRRFLKGAACGAGAVSILPIIGTRSARAVQGIPGRFMVVINMLGGNDGLNTVVPAHLTPYVSRRPTINLVDANNRPAGTSLLDLDGNFKLHYNMPAIKQIWDQNDLHIVQKVSYPSPNQSHFTSQDIMSFGVRDSTDNDGRGWLGRFADEYCSNPNEPLGVVSVGMGRRRDFESDVTTPLILSSVSGFNIDSDNDYRTDHVLRERVVRSTMATDPIPGAEPAFSIFDANRQAYDLIDQVQSETVDWVDPANYPGDANGPVGARASTISRNLKTISNLLAGQDTFNTKVFYTGFGGFDTHSGQDGGAGGRHANLMEQLDLAVDAFRADMVSRSMWNQCTIVVISEFGRRVFQNGSVGTDHGHGSCFLVMGGLVKGKNVAGGFTGDIVEADIATNNTLPFEHDFRDLYGNVIQNHLGVSPAPLFPDPDYTAA
ncbi:MAG: DUF1501 domain-containing protein, partial [Planctomycetota bacterium]